MEVRRKREEKGGRWEGGEGKGGKAESESKKTVREEGMKRMKMGEKRKIWKGRREGRRMRKGEK